MNNKIGTSEIELNIMKMVRLKNSVNKQKSVQMKRKSVSWELDVRKSWECKTVRWRKIWKRGKVKWKTDQEDPISNIKSRRNVERERHGI